VASVELAKYVYWVGVIDWDIRDFHGYETKKGTTYNAYLIIDDKTVLVDTVKHSFKKALVQNIQELTDVGDLDYVIVNHVEVDHSGSLSSILQCAKNATVIATQRGKDGVAKYFGTNDWRFETVKTGDELKTGTKTLKFVEAPMLHWPDSMFTYLREDEILLPNDAFGQHLATSNRFDDMVDQAVLMDEAAKYYANILMPFAPLIPKKIEELPRLGMKPRVIAPSHGVIWRANPQNIIKAYLEWSSGIARSKAVIVYDTMWESTRKMAYAISEGIAEHGVEAQVFRLSTSDVSQILKEILEAKAVVVGSSTLNNSMLPTVSRFLNYVAGLRPKGKIWASFGSYGWGGGAVRATNKQLKEAGFEVLEPGPQIQYAPNPEELQRCKEFGKKIAEKIIS